MADWINIAFDLIMLCAIAGMWLLWWRTSRKQRAIETMLLEAARELDVATSRLGESLEYIRRLKQERDAPRAAAEPRRPAPARRREAKPAPARKAPAREEPRKPEPGSGHITQILRMHREGRDVDSIAESLKLPKAQVKLLLKLHAAGGR